MPFGCISIVSSLIDDWSAELRYEHGRLVRDGYPVDIELPCGPPVMTESAGSALLRLLCNVHQQRTADMSGPDEERKAA